MRIDMTGKKLNIDMTLNLQWILASLVAVAIVAGTVMYRSETNQKEIEKLQIEFRRSLDKQTQSNAQLSSSIVQLNNTLIRIDGSLQNEEERFIDLKQVVDAHGRDITELKIRVENQPPSVNFDGSRG